MNKIFIIAKIALLIFPLFQPGMAEPMLKLLNQPVTGRITPPPMTIDDYHGKIQRRYEIIRFIAPGGELRWNAWENPDYIALVRAAMQLVEERALNNEACNHYFSQRMSRGKTFSEIWNADGPERIRISFSPGSSGTWRAATYTPFE